MKMTLEQIDKQIAELMEKKEAELKKKKQKELLKKQKLNAQIRKLESRVKYIIGGYVLKASPDYVSELVDSNSIREQDKITLQKYLDLKPSKKTPVVTVATANNV